MFILVYCADFNRDSTYHDVLLSMCGKRAQQISALSIMFTCYGINITFLVIIGDQYDRIFNSLLEPEFIEANWWLDRKFTILITAVLFIWPMCYAQRLDFLRHASVLGMFAMLYVSFLTVYEHYMLDEATIAAAVARLQATGEASAGAAKQPAPSNISEHHLPAEVAAPKSVKWFEPLAVVPVLCFAYQTHEVIVPVYACMKERLIGSFMKASIFGLVILFLLYNLVGAFGYLTFGENVGADVMSLYDAQDPIVVVGVVALVVKFITTYPPLMFCGRSALDGLYAEFRALSTSEFKAHERGRRCVISTIWFLTTVALAAFAPDISVTLQLLGSMASINVFVFPGMCLVSLTRRLRAARKSLLIGELPEGLNLARQQSQRAKDFYLISGSYFGAVMKNDVALKNHCRQQQTSCCSPSPTSPLAKANYSATSPKQFTATFASLLELENNLTSSCNGAPPAGLNQPAPNGACGSSGRGTGEILSSISTPSSASSLGEQRQSKFNSLVNGYEICSHRIPNQQLQLKQITQMRRRQEEFERLMTNSNSSSAGGPCCLDGNSLNGHDQQVPGANYHQHSYSSCGPLVSPAGGAVNESYDDYIGCLGRDCPNTDHLQGHQQQLLQQCDKMADQQLHLLSHQQSQQPTARAPLHIGAADGSSAGTTNERPNTRLIASTAVTNQTARNARLQQSIRYHCQHCHNHSSYQQQGLCLQNSLNYVCQQSTTGSLFDKLGASIAPSTVAQVGISQCTATGLYLFAVVLILFGTFIFFLELISVLGFLQ